MSEHTDGGQMVGTDIPDVDQVENIVMCVSQDNHQEISHQVVQGEIGLKDEDHHLVGGSNSIKVEEQEVHDSVLALHHGNVTLHNVSVTTASNQGIITIPVVGTLSHGQYSMLGDNDTVVTPINVPMNQGNVNQNQGQHHQSANQLLSWDEAVSAEILPVRCKDTNAELFKAKFGSGNKGRCIKAGDDWYTPTEFEAFCGRGNSKDWKRSIRFGGRTLQTLIETKFLVPHASSCICSNCVDDATATGPIRPFTPYQRKRKGRSSGCSKGAKLERVTSKDSTTDESSGFSTLGTSGMNNLAFNPNPLTQALLKMTQPNSLPDGNEESWKKMESAVEKLISTAVLLKSMLQEMKDRTHQEIESLRSQLNDHSQKLQEALNQAQQQTQQVTISRNLEPQILRIFDSNRIQTYSIEVLDPDSFKQVQVAQTAPQNNAPKVSSTETTTTTTVLPPISQLF